MRSLVGSMWFYVVLPLALRAIAHHCDDYHLRPSGLKFCAAAEELVRPSSPAPSLPPWTQWAYRWRDSREAVHSPVLIHCRAYGPRMVAERPLKRRNSDLGTMDQNTSAATASTGPNAPAGGCPTCGVPPGDPCPTCGQNSLTAQNRRDLLELLGRLQTQEKALNDSMSQMKAQFGVIQGQFDKVDQYAQGVQQQLEAAESNWSQTLPRVQQGYTSVGQRVKDLESLLSAAPAAVPPGGGDTAAGQKTLESKLDQWSQDVTSRLDRSEQIHTSAGGAILELQTQVKRLLQRVAQAESAGAASGPNTGGVPSAKERSQKPLLESKAISGLGTFDGTRSHYQEWIGKLKDAVDVWCPEFRDVFAWLEGVSGPITETEYDKGLFTTSFQQANAQLWSVLSTKTTGEARSKVVAGVRGDGLEAYRRVHKWYTALSGLGVSDKYAKIMVPPIPKRDADVANTIEAWESELRDLVSLKPDLIMPDEFKRTALKRMLTPNVKEYVEAREAELGSYKEMRDLIMDWALRRHRERADVPDVDMGSINQVPEFPGSEWDADTPPGLGASDPWSQWPLINAVGKGKASGKGHKGWKGAQWGGFKGYGTLASGPKGGFGGKGKGGAGKGGKESAGKGMKGQVDKGKGKVPMAWGVPLPGTSWAQTQTAWSHHLRVFATAAARQATVRASAPTEYPGPKVPYRSMVPATTVASGDTRRPCVHTPAGLV